mmetsp:Transcript_123759/g.214549  ORF Transcript_123759/g.214549 Transcript_123759/m.214549 type:complete len:241 (-) Transcript_123759:354-1076(-)
MWFLTGCCSVTSDKPAQIESPDKTTAVASAKTTASTNGVTSPPLKANSSGNTSAVRGENNGTVAHAPPTEAALSKLGKKEGNARMETDASSVASTQKSARSAFSAASSIGSEIIKDRIPESQREVAKIQSQMKSFVKSMVKGREMNVLSVDGQLRACTCSFDRKLRNYNIVISKETRSIALSRFREVFQGLEPEDIATPLDELCATFVLDNGECLTFRFNDVEERENFAMCLAIIVDGYQ